MKDTVTLEREWILAEKVHKLNSENEQLKQLLDAAKDENQQLREENKQWRKDIATWGTRKDAKRYNFLYDNPSKTGYLLQVWEGHELTEAIDAAMEQE